MLTRQNTAQFFAILVSLLFFIAPTMSYAATLRSGENIRIENDEKLSDLYLFGSKIRVDAPITNDLVAAGHSVSIDQDVSGSIFAAGGNLAILSGVGNTLRIAGGKVVIDGPVGRDVIVVASSLQVTKKASIGGDLIFTGGKLSLEGPVKGWVHMNGGEVHINSAVKGSVIGEVQSLSIGKSGDISGDLRYSSSRRAVASDTSNIRGEHAFQKIEATEGVGRKAGKLVMAGTYYKLFADILFSLLFVIIIPLFLRKSISEIRKTPLVNIGVGLCFFLVIPVVAVFLLLIIWLGVFTFLVYCLFLVITMVIANIFAGERILAFFYQRNSKEYVLDWKAAVVGPVALFLLWLIPLLGWLAAFGIYLLTLGGLVRHAYLQIGRSKNNGK